MAHLSTRDPSGGGLSGTAIIAIVAGVGGALLCGIIIPVILLVRARRQHNRFIADLEKKGIYLAQARNEAEESVARPRNVLRRNTGLPFDGKSGWGALQSSETLQPGGPSSMVEHYVPPKPLHSSKRLNRLSWPFSKRISGHSVQMQKLKGSRLSTVMEDPKQSPLVPILGNPTNQSRLSVVTSADDVSAMSSCQSLLRHHPALRSTEQVSAGTGQAEERSYFRGDANKRLIRARSMATVSSVPDVRPLLRARSASSCQISGKAPDVILPPLPSDIERIKSEEDLTQSRLRHALSKSSVSSVESADTTILASRLSPIIPRATKARAQRITKPTPGPRTFRDTLDLRAKVIGTQENLVSDSNRSKSTPQLPTHPLGSPRRGDRPGDAITEPHSNNQRPNTAASDIGPYANASPMRFESNQRRRSKTYVSCAGSPERHGRHGNRPRNHVNGMRSPKRQHSQTSSRSSGGNPFQWDQPLSPTMKPSALKGSPGARQGSHHRKNSVRISLVPTFHGPPSRGPSSSLLIDPQQPQDGTENTVVSASGTGLGLTSPAPSTAPCDSSASAPIPQSATTTVQASLTDTSPTLPLVAYDDTFVVFPTDQVLPGLSPRERKRLSNGSVFGLSQFPAAPSVIEPAEPDLPPLPQSLSIHSLLNNDEPQVPGTPHLKQQPFNGQNSESEHSEASVTEADCYDSTRPGLVFQTPSQPGSRIFQSVCTPIEEESSIASIKTATMERVDGGISTHTSSNPPSPPRFDLRGPPSYAAATASELPETINPAMLCKDTFAILNSSVDNIGGSTSHASDVSNVNSMNRPQDLQATRQSLLGWGLNEPITSAALAAFTGESPVLGHNRHVSQASSVYSNPSPQAGMSPTASPIALPSPVIPCSPRPAHAQLPDHRLSINFAELPKLDPSPRGPRGSPPRPLRSSIAALRRMNSDCADAKHGKLDRGERRYLRIGREESVQLPGDESWLDDLSDDNSHVSINDLEGRRLVGSVLDDWDEGGTMISLGASTITQASMDPTTAQRTSDLYVINTTAGAEESSSSVWEDSEIFWSSNTPPPPQSLIRGSMEHGGGKGYGRESEVGIGAEEDESSLGSPNKPKHTYQPLASSPLITSMTSLSTPTTTPTRKRRSGFTVAMDSPSAPVSPNENIRSDKSRRYESGTSTRRESGTSATGSPSSRRRSRGGDHSPQGRRHRKRNVLGVGTPNVRIQVTSPSGSFVGGEFTPGSVLYDSQGFLRY